MYNVHIYIALRNIKMAPYAKEKIFSSLFPEIPMHRTNMFACNAAVIRHNFFFLQVYLYIIDVVL